MRSSNSSHPVTKALSLISLDSPCPPIAASFVYYHRRQNNIQINYINHQLFGGKCMWPRRRRWDIMTERRRCISETDDNSDQRWCKIQNGDDAWYRMETKQQSNWLHPKYSWHSRHWDGGARNHIMDTLDRIVEWGWVV
jgi:hypothetical protein